MPSLPTLGLPEVFQLAKNEIDITPFSQEKESLVQEDISSHAFREAKDDPSEKLRLIQRALQLYPLSTEAWELLGYHYLNLEMGAKLRNLSRAMEAFETAVRVARTIHPDWGVHRTEPLPWGCLEHRPYLRAMSGLALSFHAAGQQEGAIETAELLVRWEYSGLDDHLCTWYLESNRLEDAAKFFSRLLCKPDRYISCDVGYSMALLGYQELGMGKITSSDLDQMLLLALGANAFVPDLLVAANLPASNPSEPGTGSEEEAMKYVYNNYNLWNAVPGAIEWLRFTMGRCGDKPDEQTCLHLLRHHQLLFKFQRRQPLLATQCQDKMLGKSLPEFRMPTEMSSLAHPNGDIIVVQRYEFGEGIDDLWSRFWYKDIRSVPFWNVYLVSKAETGAEDYECQKENERTPTATPTSAKLVKCGRCKVAERPDKPHLRCSACGVVPYCSPECQKQDWKEHKKACKKFWL